MLFNTTLYLIFFTLFFIGYHFVTLKHFHRMSLIILGSFLFYSFSHPYYIILLIMTSAWDFFCALKLSSVNGIKRKYILALSLLVNIASLLIFKSLFTLELISFLPLGLSFYTFQSMAYVIDVYRQRIEPERSFRLYLACISFFPHLIAGPLLRPQDIFDQMKSTTTLNWENGKWGLWLIGAGLLKKTIADILAPHVDILFNNGNLDHSISGILCFVGQIYGDFSGYTDMAIGSALLIGIRLPKNFDRPFEATSVLNYYSSRWHLSLARWIREYLFTPISLILRRKYASGMIIALSITMTLMGLWHGFGINYIAWGFVVSFMLMINYFWIQLNIASALRAFKVWRFFSWFITFYFVCFSLTIFRSTDLLRGLHIWIKAHDLLLNQDQITILFFTVIGLFSLSGLSRLTDRDKLPDGIIYSMGLILFLTLSFTFSGPEQGFIYFQF